VSSLYEDLGVAENSTQDEIEKAYKKAALRYHPDRNPGDNEAAIIFLKIQQAYDILKDGNKRKEYDFRSKAQNHGFWQQHQYEVEDLDLHMSMQISFAESVVGTKKTIKFNRKFPCNDCDGAGFKEFKVCEHCHGSGVHHTMIAGFFNFQTPCGACNAKGRIGYNKCLACDGQKQKLHDESVIEVIIPKGVLNGMTLTLQGCGHNGRNGRIGNIFIKVEIVNDKKYQLKNLDIIFNLEVDFSTMIYGGKIEIPTFEDESIELEIPVRTQSLTNFRVKNKGMPSFNNTMLRGDLVATVIAKLPNKEFPPELLPVLKYHGI